MTFECTTWGAAVTLATRLVGIYRGTDWTVTTIRPLFDGDCWQVIVS